MSDRDDCLQRNWSAYFQATAEQQLSHDTLREALARFAAEGVSATQRSAVDLGCGTGRDTIELLRQGWHVLAIDNQQEALDRMRAGVPAERQDVLRTQLASFEEVILPRVDLVNASYSLPFCRPAHFANLWGRIVAAVHHAGRFAGHFFGLHDSWASSQDMTFLTDTQIAKLFATFELEHFQEHENDGSTATGESKHWHVYSIVARKVK